MIVRWYFTYGIIYGSKLKCLHFESISTLISYILIYNIVHCTLICVFTICY